MTSRKKIKYAIILLACYTVLIIHLFNLYHSSACTSFKSEKHPVNRCDDLRQTPNKTDADGTLITCDSRSSQSHFDVDYDCDVRPNVMDTWETKFMTIPQFYKYGNQSKKCMHRFDDTVALFHVGKAGGGTIKRALQLNRINVKMCHPTPNLCVRNLLKGPATTLIINVRDPVDRFVSAFRWRIAYLSSQFKKDLAASCNPDDEGTVKECEMARLDREEDRVLVKTYRSDPNVLAEALCTDSPSAKTASADYAKIRHSLTLAEWLRFLINPKMVQRISGGGIQNLIALPLEKQGGEVLFERHIEQLSLHLLRTRYEQGITEDILNQKPPDEGRGRIMCQHSGVRFHNKKNTSVPSALSPLGECCVARYLKNDYRLIKVMIGDAEEGNSAVEPFVGAHPVISKACLWGSEKQQNQCRSDLRSMLKRRARYMDQSLGSCSQVAERDK